MLVVCNTSPISNLAIVDLLDLLRMRYGRVIIPQRVKQELDALTHSDGKRRIQSAVDAGWIAVQTLETRQLCSKFEQRVDPGEAEAIALAETLKADKLIIDDRLGRELARERGVSVAGLLGELLHAKIQGRLRSVKEAIELLQREARFFIRSDLRELIVRDAGE